MLEYLKIKHEYAIRPTARAFVLLGTAHHIQLAKPVGKWIAEQHWSEEDISGTSDLLEPDEKVPGSHILTDYKSFGSFRVALLLGLVSEVTYPPDGERYVNSGKWGKAGDIKPVKIWKRNPDKVSAIDEELQLNHYRLLAESSGFPISRMQLQVTVRDGGILAARDRGITEDIYIIPIKRLPDEDVANYFRVKRLALEHALAHNEMPPPCSEHESWERRRCKDYCDVAALCPQGQRVLAGG